MSASGPDARKVLRVSTIASESEPSSIMFPVLIRSLDDIKHYTLLNHSLIFAEAAKRLLVDWMHLMYVVNFLDVDRPSHLSDAQRHRE